MKNIISFEDFDLIDLRIGTIISVNSFENIKKSAYQLLINFDSLGKLKSSAQIKDLYSSEELIGKQIIAVVNTGERNIGSFISECLVLGITIEDGVSLLKPDLKTTDGIQVV